MNVYNFIEKINIDSYRMGMVYSRNQLFQLWCLIVLGPLVCKSLDIGVICSYLLVILLCVINKKYFNNISLVFFISFMYLYPNIAYSLYGINEKGILLGMSCIAFYFLYRQYDYSMDRDKSFKYLILFCFMWGSFIYFVSLADYMLFELTGKSFLVDFGYLSPKTSHIMFYVKTVCTVLIVFAPIVCLKNDNNFKVLFQIYVFLLIINILSGLIGYFFGIRFVEEGYSVFFTESAGGEARIFSHAIVCPIIYGRMMSFPILLLACFFLRKANFAYLVIFCFGTLALLLTLSRAVYVSFGVGLMVVFWYSGKKLKGIVSAGIIIFLVVAAVYYVDIPYRFYSTPRLRNIINIGTRDHSHNIAIYFISKYVFFGAMPGRMVEMSRKMGPAETAATAHNLFLQKWVDYGLPMVLGIIFVFVYSFWTGRNVLKKNKTILARRENFYVNTFLICSTVYTIVLFLHGLSDSVGYTLIFLNLGYIVAARNILMTTIKKRKNVLSSNQRIPALE